MRGIYTVPVNDGCGPLNGSMECTRTFDVPPIHKEAADAIERKDADIAELRARIADAPTVCANIDNIVEIAHSLGYYDGKRVALVVVND